MEAQSPVKLSLHDAVAQAQASSQAREGQDRVDVTHGYLTGAELRPNPRVYVSSEDLEPWSSHFHFSNNTEDFGYLGQLFELGGKRAARVGVARASMAQAQSERLLLLRQIAGRVAGAYWTCVAAQGVATLLEQEMKAVDRIVLYNKERVEAGAARGVDLLRVQIERDRLVLALESARRDAVLSRIELSKQMGQEPLTAVELTDTFSSAVSVPTESVEAVLAVRVDLQVMRDAINVAEANLKLQRSLGTSDLDVLAGYKRNSGANTLFTSFQLPLNFRNRNQGEVERAQATIRLQQDRLTQLEREIRSEVLAATEAYTHQRKSVEVVVPEMQARARQNLAIQDDAYRTGGTDLLHFLDAERTEFEIELSALRTQAEFRQAIVRLQFASGVQP